jgi:hypothetical protein
MRISQGEFGGFVVVETDGLPFCRRMTRSAFLPVAASVHVLNFVAVDTEPRQIFITFADMTDGALYIAMRALKRKLSLGMIKRFLLAPRFLRVT